MQAQRKRWKTVIVASLMIILIFTSLSYATGGKRVKKILQAWYGTVNIIYNGQNMTAQFEPFIVDGTTYVPLRTMSTIFNKNVGWNATTNTATVTDKPTESFDYLRQQIIIKDAEISDLKKKIEDLEEELDGRKKGSGSIRDLEKDLQDEYGKYEKIDFDITLKGDRKDIDVKIEVDLGKSKYRDRWDDLSNRKIENYIEDICDDILYEFPDANIEGYIRDTDEREDLISFYTTSKGKVVIEDEDRDRDTSLRDLEKDLDDTYYDYFRDITLEIKLKGDSRDVEYTVNIDYNKYKKEWDKLSDKDIKKLMSNIYDDIEYEWSKADITGYVYDKYGKGELAEYYRSSSGKESFYRD
ncbi:MAG: hypothetical protein GX987_01440 [Tissierellia bacterium]|nr:hypothetical protein [Tissierellia bacterium]